VFLLKSKSHCDWRSVSQSVCLGVEPKSGTFDQRFFFQSYCLVFLGRPLWREVGSVMCQSFGIYTGLIYPNCTDVIKFEGNAEFGHVTQAACLAYMFITCNKSAVICQLPSHRHSWLQSAETVRLSYWKSWELFSRSRNPASIIVYRKSAYQHLPK
jgi:hypothetical protein